MEEKVLTSCVSCTIGLLISFTSILGFPCITVKCLHNKFVNKTEITFSKLCCCSAVTVAIFLIGISFHYIYLIVTAFTEKNSALTIIILLTNLFLCIRPCVSIILCVCKSGIMVNNFRGLEKIRQNWKANQKEDLLEMEAVRSFRKRTVYCFMILACVLLVYATYLMIIDFDTNWSVLRKVATILCFCVDSTLVIIYTSAAKFYTTFFSTYQKNLRNKLLKYKSEKFTTSKIQNSSLRKILILNRRLHCALMWNIKYYNRFCDPGTAIWLIITIILLVANSFVLLTIWIDKSLDLFESGFIGLELQLFLATLTITNSLSNLHELGSVVWCLI
ncbi:hypothetical protein ILUMI_12371 [Ignelater luminosus]|uniref:Uncharacterized protein n=1 Tax=Ignelater luminosus TaxID=2038154 RepID=A0A8K0D300_IGNLU|nr:hypothetical protein ILUMI_12371 [Ignelater luminosus]